MWRPAIMGCAAALAFAGPACAQPIAGPAVAAAPAGAILGTVLHSGDIARSTRFYVDGLGMRVAMRMGPATRHETILTFGSDPSQPSLILLSDETAGTQRAITRGHGYDRLVLRMVDLDAASTRLKSAGYAPSPIRDVAMGYRMMMVTDPDGYELELVQSAPRR